MYSTSWRPLVVATLHIKQTMFELQDYIIYLVPFILISVLYTVLLKHNLLLPFSLYDNFVALSDNKFDGPFAQECFEVTPEADELFAHTSQLLDKSCDQYETEWTVDIPTTQAWHGAPILCKFPCFFFPQSAEISLVGGVWGACSPVNFRDYQISSEAI